MHSCSGRRRLAAALACGLAVGGAWADDGGLVVHQEPSTLTLGYESLHLPGGERMGLLGANYLFELLPGWRIGPAFYGAASGDRGGLFTWGAEAQRIWQPAPRWRIVTGLYIGGGGGASAPVGGGLMLRPHADLLFGLGGWGAGVSLSQVRFPSGSISSNQIGLIFTRDIDFAYTDPGHHGEGLDFSDPGGLGFDSAGLIVGHYSTKPGGGPSPSYVGLRLERHLGPVLSATLEAEGAASGGAGGYAEAGVGAQALLPLAGNWLAAGARASLGLGGGGAVQTGSGRIAKVAAIGRLRLGPSLTLDLEAGKARAIPGNFSATYGQVTLGVALESPAPCSSAFACRAVHEMEWGLAYQTYLHAQRNAGGQPSMGVIGLKFNRWLDSHFYFTGQALTAVTGGAGAYSTGLFGLGAGLHGGGWSAGAEALVGAAGGGGVATSGGAVTQPMLWAGHDLGRFGRLRLGAGYLKSLHGDLATPVVDLTWALEFGNP